MNFYSIDPCSENNRLGFSNRFLLIIGNLLSKIFNPNVIEYNTSHLEDFNYTDDICLLFTKYTDIQSMINDLGKAKVPFCIGCDNVDLWICSAA